MSSRIRADSNNRVNATVPKSAKKMKNTGKKFEPVIYDGAGCGFVRAGEAPNASEGNKKARGEAGKRRMERLQKL